MTDSNRYDAIVVGARCGGAATAMLLARQGMRVLCIDRSAYGSDTRSTHALMRPAVHLLARWGVLESIKAAGTPIIRSTTFHYESERVAVPIKPAGGVDGLYGPRRTVLDAALVDAAREAGAVVQHGVRALGLVRDGGGRVSGVQVQTESGAGGRAHELRADLVIGADGLRSAVAGWVGAEPYRRAQNATCGFYGYFRGLSQPDYHWHFAAGVGTGTVATNDGLTLAFASVTPERFGRTLQHDRRGGLLRLFAETDPELSTRLGVSEQVGPLYGFPAVRGFHRPCAGPGWALVGDAGYFRDPLTAHGITDAFRDAELLSRAASIGTAEAFTDYQATRDALTLRFSEITDEVAGLAWDERRVQQLHHDMAREMKRELRFLEGLPGLESEHPTPTQSSDRAYAGSSPNSVSII